MRRACGNMVMVLGVAGLSMAEPEFGKDAKAANAPARIVSMGDSITDGNTYPLLVRQALAEAGKSVPIFTNAGVAGDTAQWMRKRLKRDVLAHRPTLVTLSVGINDILHKVKLADYEADVGAIAERLAKSKVPLLILTMSVLGPKLRDADGRLADYNAILRRVAKTHHCRIAEVNALMQKARSGGAEILETDQVHPNFEGHRVMARAILDALGHGKVPVPQSLKVELMPGIIRSWQFQAVDDREPPLDEKGAKSLGARPSLKKYSLPEKEEMPSWWLDQERKRGFGLSLDKLIGKGKGYLGFAVLESKQGRPVYFNTGAQLNAIWLNGKRIYKNEGWTGWHAGKERVPARLQEGRNEIVIETGSQFFLSVSDTNRW